MKSELTQAASANLAGSRIVNRNEKRQRISAAVFNHDQYLGRSAGYFGSTE
jgi:hypothetical protein